MWIIFGIITAAATIFNLYLYHTDKDYKLAMAIALSFTALTLAAEYRMAADWVKKEDWAALADVLPTMEKWLWVFAISSILLNMVPILFRGKKLRK